MTNPNIIGEVSGNVNRLLKLKAQKGADAANALLFGIGTSSDPATTSVADKKVFEYRCQSTATSGDNRLLYMRYELNGTGGGECIRAFTKLTATIGTARGAHISLDVATTGAITGLGVGVDAQILIGNSALSGGTWAVVNAEIFSAGTSSDPAGNVISYFRAVNGGNSTGGADVDDDVSLFSIQGHTIGSGNLIVTEVDETKFSHKIRILIGSTTYYLMLTAT